MKTFLLSFFTLNAAELLECSELTSLNAVTLADAPADGWYLISPTGTFPEPDGRYVQVFERAQAEDVVTTFNSFTGRAARHIKNMWHGFGLKSSIPIFEGHSDRDPKRWPTMNRLGEISDLRADDSGLWGMVTWNAENLAHRTSEFGPLKPSPVYWHEPKDASGRVYPAMLESVGLVRFPNIKSAPAWTQNAIPLADDPAEKQKAMNHKDQLIALLGLKSDADDAAIQSSLDAHSLKVTSTANALTEATSAKEKLENDLTTANGQVTNLTTERDTLTTANADLTTANAALTTEVTELRKGVLDLAEKKGAITPAERPAFETKLTTANSRPAALSELPGRKAMNVTSVTINNERIDLTTANARRDALAKAVNDRMEADKTDYDTAFARVKADPNFAALFAAMQDPTQKAA